eukprot:TRINITY_DN6373_c0_g1_i2.p2 TRINITY_DN6373_c0_g1~~TRINITY_DN6373_c0_g1_i2.p2  ORF type:complete len:369 (-),score=131.32 TRINITY_DN6373_c0_g1_i2:1463-2470(-)
MGATNRKDFLDPALTRPGRFDRQIEVTLPDVSGRKAISLVHLAKIKLDPEKTPEDYAKRIAALTPGFSGADLANLVNEAAILAARKGKNAVTTTDFEEAAERVLAGLAMKSGMSQEERRRVALHESGHAVVSWFLPGGSPLVKVTIIPRAKGSLGFAQYLPDEAALQTKEELLDRIACLLGGRISEELFLKNISTGAADDLKKVSEIARAIVMRLGMSDKVGNVAFANNEQTGLPTYSKQTGAEIDEEVKRIVDQAREKCTQILSEKSELVHKLSDELLAKETLDLQALVDVLGERPFQPKGNYKAYLEIRSKLQEDQPSSPPNPTGPPEAHHNP